MKKSAALNFVKWLAGFFVIILLLYQLYQLFYNPFTTNSAVYFETYEGIDVVVVAIRDEQVLSDSVTDGAKRYLVEDGEKVSKDGVIAEIYENSADADAKGRVEELENNIQRLTEIQSYNDLSAANLNTIDEKIQSELLGLLNSDSNGKYDYDRHIDELLFMLNRKQIITGQIQNFNGILSALSSEKSTLESTHNLAPVSTIKTSHSGYFVSTSDGFEETLSPDNIDDISVETIREVIADSDITDKGDKVISEYSWYLAAEISLSDSLKLKEGTSITLKTSTDSNPQLPVTVYSVNRSKDGTNVVVVFKCNHMNGELASVRTLPVTIILGSYEGLKVPSASVRTLDGKNGVYKISGNKAVFVPVDIIYSTDSYVVCRKDDKTMLKLYDEVIVKGKRLYDGKIIR